MPKLSGFDVLERIKSCNRKTRSIVISTHDDDASIICAFEKGANAFLSKSADPDEIFKAIRSVIDNSFYFNDKVNNAMLSRWVLKKKIAATYNNNSVKFSEKETKILHLLCEECSNAEIAEKIYLSPRTVETIRQKMIKKVGVKNVVGLVLYAAKNQMM